VSKWIKAHKKDPFFIFINFMEPHLPYEPPMGYAQKYIRDGITEEEIKKYSPNIYDIKTLVKKRERGPKELEVINSLYDGEINYLDEKIGELFHQFKDLNLADETLFIITSDHGENLGEHGLVGHAYGLYETLLKVPLILRYPKYFKPGLEVENKIQTTDIFYTILDMVSIKRSPSQLKMARSLSLRLKEGHFEEIMISEHDRPNHVLRWARKEAFHAEYVDKDLTSISMNGYKYIFSTRGEEELYDLKADPYESHNLISEKREIAAELKSRLGEIYKTDRARAAGGKKIQMDKETESKLRSLGYIK
jgi:arylsulfatase A-like enzyme